MRSLPLFLFLVVVAGCEFQEVTLLEEPLPCRDQPAFSNDTDRDILLHTGLWKQQGAPAKPAFKIESTRIYPCANTELPYRWTASSDERLHLHLEPARKTPDVCQATTGPARSYLTIPCTDGTYELTVTSEEYAGVNTFRLTLSEEAIRLTPVATSFVHFTDTLIWQFPPQTFAVGCMATTTAQARSCKQFVTALEERFDLERVVPKPPSGRWPYECRTTPFGDYPVGVYRYASEADFNAISAWFADAVGAFKSDNPLFWVKLTNWLWIELHSSDY